MVIAEKLGKTLTELRQTMTLEEVYLWQAFYQFRAEEEEKAMEKARKQNQRRR